MPYTSGTNTDSVARLILYRNGKPVAMAYNTDEGGYGAEDIRRIVDEHNALIDACRKALLFGEGHPDRTPGWHQQRLDVQVALREAIAKATRTP